MLQIETLVASLSRSVELLTCDIKIEEDRVRVHDVSHPAYPCLARHLQSRRAKLNETIAALRSRWQKLRTDAQTPADSMQLQDF